ncbi:hypothetical protein HETIRDRAFT_409763 [Heterobasidion irregulare TC 32-1]|uniref:Uncharacterized protein n=1 Tax=Heterobasidion irregulare (strain TC 32-1) TaxID=747525 RepID=W4K8X9_HETIT|nr:uncharacterized protein HETIRDRAFT_409763 [Heterobasidion irregulare TC 32-1]ETW82248.1 hypothetical protein HETIRDRAFT_409763 [Heterobasidion irregulare TC 32-1]
MTKKVLPDGLYDAFALVEWLGQPKNHNNADHQHPHKTVKTSPRTYSPSEPEGHLSWIGE